MALISILGSDPALGIKSTNAGWHPALGGVQEQICSQIWNQHLWFSMWACALLFFKTAPGLPSSIGMCARANLIPDLESAPLVYVSMCITIFENCSRIAIQHWEVSKSKSDLRFGISTFALVCEHVHHYFWKLLQDYDFPMLDGKFSSKPGYSFQILPLE